MKIAFFGTPEPAADCLQALLDAKHEIVGVVTQPDRPKGRGREVAFSPVKKLALDKGLLIEQPEKIKGEEVVRLIGGWAPDIAVVVAYGQILPANLLTIPKHGFINLHASLLPKYRGAAPIQWALLNGEKESGVTIMKINEWLDAGEIILQKKTKIDDQDDAITLSKKLFSAGKEALLEALEQIKNGQASFLPQAEGAATFAPSLTKESGEIDWRKPAVEINNRVRGLVPWPAAHTFWRQKRLKIWRADVLPGQNSRPGEIGEIVRKSGFIVGAGQGDLLVLEVQIEGKNRVLASDFVLGYDVKKGDQIPS